MPPVLDSIHQGAVTLLSFTVKQIDEYQALG